jgi:pimeloyl-ACP methyl ester carboxylesterase|tara:strand:- start:345 stop:1109 length:765 start_codon:yes stop_codon:yes gene_type:complete
MINQLNFRQLGSGKDIIILHGLLGSLDNWISVAHKLASNYKITILDLPNHGKSYHSDLFSYKEMADVLNNFIEKKNILNPTIIGHSMGGKVALQYAELFPKSISQLVVVDVFNKEYDTKRFAHIFKAISVISSSKFNSRKEANDLIKEIVVSEGERNFVLKNLKRNEDGFSWYPNVDLLNKSIFEISSKIHLTSKVDISTLFIKGQNSNYIMNEDIDGLPNLFSNFKVIEVPNSGHWVHAENPSAFISTIENFI